MISSVIFIKQLMYPFTFQKKTSQTESYAEDFNIDYNFGGESNNANLAAAFSNAIDENGEVNFDDTEF